MSKIITAIALSLMLVSTTSCYVRVNDKFEKLTNSKSVSVKPCGETVSQSYTFDKISSILINNGHLDYTQGDSETPYVIITTDKNYLEHIDVTNEDGALSVIANIKNLNSKNDIKISVYSRTLESLYIAGAGEMNSHSINVEKDLFEASISGAGELNIDSLRGHDMNISVIGAGNLNIGSVKANDCSIVIAGAGDADAFFEKARNVSVSLSGAGDITLGGECDFVDASGSGAGDIDIRNLKYGDSKIYKSGSVQVRK